MTSARIPAITQKQVASFLTARPRDSHKGQFGTVAVIGGANGMAGAALLAGRAALKLGAGCVHVGMLADNTLGVDMQQAELMIHNAATLLLTLPLPNPLPQASKKLLAGHPGEGVLQSLHQVKHPRFCPLSLRGRIGVGERHRKRPPLFA